MKGLVLCAGKGTRLQPFSYSQPKTLLPVANKPVLKYCIENLTKNGIKDIGIVIHPSQDGIQQLIGNGDGLGANITYIFQTEQKGISHAVKQAESFIDGEPFILLLGDNLIAEDLSTLIDSYQRNRTNGSILLSPVPNPQDFGIAEIKGNDIVRLEEKPKKPKSNLAVIGAYLFDSQIFHAVNSIKPSARGEYEITDAIQWLIDQGHSITYTITRKLYSDVGTVDRWLEANQWMLEKEYEGQILLGKNTVVENCTLIAPIVIGDDCILRNAVIGPFVSIQDQCRIENCQIDQSILLEKNVISHLQYPVSKSVFGREVHLEGTANAKSLHFYLGDKSRLTMKRNQGDLND
ncbi:glucose-1-phosphate thymidylyltransferase [Ammoniphilus sp. CFH 90114]|uniref:glucose-1-phosphate thymidylyltransferase n=1 Tax=Ammoniphilus sp. CFH 90114 TaxID=2493665 RepID=UPI00100E0D33|nr:glucose-1-phosphate thymidylyltransferase [Ammoniphilus sp. CFH 90114]RXT13969.1 glucose-1-phosphate thymidylyltransferase [Ammoniphilus sp. CFH 90114]